MDDLNDDRYNFRVLHAKAEEALKSIPGESVDSIVTDPPAGIGFMGGKNAWDSDRGGRDRWVEWLSQIMKECLRVAKPGAHMFVWALPRTSHWTATAIENAGWDVKEIVTSHNGQGFAKGGNISKLIDKRLGAEREVVGDNPNHRAVSGVNYEGIYAGGNTGAAKITAPATDEAKQWDDWATGLRPNSEHWILARKPISGSTIVGNVLEHGTGALNIGACRVITDEKLTRKLGKTTESKSGWKSVKRSEIAGRDGGRWPSNVVLVHAEHCVRVHAEGSPSGLWACIPGCPVRIMDSQSGVSVSRKGKPRKSIKPGEGYGKVHTGAEYNDEGGSSRFYNNFKYSSKPGTKEKEQGCEGLYWQRINEGSGFLLISKERWDLLDPKDRAEGNVHSTVKGLPLMKWLISLITPPGGLVLDPFTGSGTTGLACVDGFRFIGIEEDVVHHKIAEARIDDGLRINSDEQAMEAEE